jgi:sterol desaturase/sphingolipid hydroxylase (fatty acid hydroxylase superfamily)
MTVFTALVPLTFVTMLVLERLFPARELPKRRFWLVQGIAFFVLTALIAAVPPAVFAGLLAPYAPLHLGGVPIWIAGPLAFVATDLVHYALHRLQHNWPWLWRWTHQMHHSAERVDIAGAAIFHPLELLLLSATSTSVAVLLGLFVGMFQHLNVRTPRWLGYIIQRPEAHAIHHARGVHAYNYGNVMLWDLALGTFRNPATFSATPSGFWDGASQKLLPMLAGRDVAEPTT